MLKSTITDLLTQALEKSLEPLNIASSDEALSYLNIERPKQTQFGDFAVNVSPLAKLAKLPPPKIAQTLVDNIPVNGTQTSIVGGFINFTLSDKPLYQALLSLLHAPEPGKNTALSDTRCLLEYVSANPTGPLHIGHGRWVALGNSLTRIMQHCGATVSQEFYVNDAGSQMVNIAKSVWFRSLEILGTGGKLPEAVEGQPYPFYAGQYVIDFAEKLCTQHKDQLLAWDSPSHEPPPEAIAWCQEQARAEMLSQQQALMERCRLVFDAYFSEKTLHDSGKVVEMVQVLKDRGVAYEKDGALWLASAQFGDDQDRVLIKSDGQYTYLTADIAYHHEKFTRKDGFYNRCINIWGADHHGYIPRMKAALTALGHDPERLEIVLGQLVNLMIDGERTRMGKRKKMLTLEELVDEVGVDALRFWMVSKSQDTSLDFNVDLAASASDENPVFYVQYAHARCCSILRNAVNERLDTHTKTTVAPLLQPSEWDTYLANANEASIATLIEQLPNDESRLALKALLIKLDSFEETLINAAKLRMPHIVVRYLMDLSADFHYFYNLCRILADDPQVAKPRLLVIVAIQRVLKQGLALLGVSAPEQM